ncbi:MAG: hypothetical protein ACLRHF_09160 [Bifidobacterium bifidum]
MLETIEYIAGNGESIGFEGPLYGETLPDCVAAHGITASPRVV